MALRSICRLQNSWHKVSGHCAAVPRIRLRSFCSTKPDPNFKSTINTVGSSNGNKNGSESDQNKSNKRLKKWGLIGAGVGLLYFFAMRKMQRRLDGIDLADMHPMVMEGITQSFRWYYKHLGLGMLREDRLVLNRFNCRPEELFVVRREETMSMQEMFDQEEQCVKIHFGITNRYRDIFGYVTLKMTPKRWDNSVQRDMFVKDLGANNSQYVFLSVLMEDGEEIVAFDGELTENDYPAERIQKWFEDENIEIDP